jgi:hypothetical protein
MFCGEPQRRGSPQNIGIIFARNRLVRLTCSPYLIALLVRLTVQEVVEARPPLVSPYSIAISIIVELAGYSPIHHGRSPLPSDLDSWNLPTGADPPRL